MTIYHFAETVATLSYCDFHAGKSCKVLKSDFCFAASSQAHNTFRSSCSSNCKLKHLLHEMKYISCLCRTIEHCEKPNSQLGIGFYAVLRSRGCEWRDLGLLVNFICKVRDQSWQVFCRWRLFGFLMIAKGEMS